MTRKHFILIASILKKYYTCEITKNNLLAKQGFFELICEFVTLCESENPQFDKDRFLKACGVDL